jgi:hypothetical protein
MEIRSYINILIFLIAIIIFYYAINYGDIKTRIEAFNDIKLPESENIESYDMRTLKKIVDEQNDIIDKQSHIINDYITTKEKNEKKYYVNEIKPDEDFENYFKELQDENDKTVNNTLKDDTDYDILNHYKTNLNIVKTYLEDPVTRGSNIYDSEQYSKLLDVGNIILDNGVKLPHPDQWSINIYIEDKLKKEQKIDQEYYNVTTNLPDRTLNSINTSVREKQ